MTKGDMYTKQILNRILEEGTLIKIQGLIIKMVHQHTL